MRDSIRMYLIFRPEEAEEGEVRAHLSALGLEDCTLSRTRAGELYVSFPETRAETCVLGEAAAQFLCATPKAEVFNALSFRCPGAYTLEIVPETAGGRAPALALCGPLLRFIRALDALDCIDIDQYFY